MKRSKIICIKGVNPNNGSALVLLADGTQVWVPAAMVAMVSQGAEVTYSTHKAGDKYVSKDGSEGTFTKDGVSFEGCELMRMAESAKLQLLHALKALPE